MELRSGCAGVGPCLEPGLSQWVLGCLEGPLLVQDQSVPEFALTSACLGTIFPHQSLGLRLFLLPCPPLLSQLWESYYNLSKSGAGGC